MAQNLANAEGIVADNNYPKGYKIVDNQTTVGAHINQDIIQFFQKLMKEGNVTPNGLDDNEHNGYQFIEALIKSLKYLPTSKITGLLSTDSDAGIVELATDFETRNGIDYSEHSGTNYPIVIKPSSLSNYTKRIYHKLITVSDWDTITNPTKLVAHGISWSSFNPSSIKSKFKILNIRVSASVLLNGVESVIEFTNNGEGYIDYIDDTNILLRRKNGGYFDNEVITSNFTLYIMIMYIPE